MSLNDTQKQQVAQWIEQGLKLSDIQSRISTDFGLSMTYMDVRFLIDDLKLKLKDPVPVKQAAPLTSTPDTQGAAPAPAGEEADAMPPDEAALPPAGGKVSVELDKLVRPGAIVSGKVTFSDGKTAEWYLDQMGRLGLTPKEEGYRASQPDLMEFQRALQSELAKMGF